MKEIKVLVFSFLLFAPLALMADTPGTPDPNARTEASYCRNGTGSSEACRLDPANAAENRMKELENYAAIVDGKKVKGSTGSSPTER